MSPFDKEDHDMVESESTSSLSTLAAKPLDNEVGKFARAVLVGFADVEIREYNRIVGDHPDVKVGPPIAIGWEFMQHPRQSIDDYEKNRPAKKVILRMSSITRKNLLHNVFGYSEEEIRDAEKEVQKIQRRREQSNKQGKRGAVLEVAVTSTARKIKRVFSGEIFFKGFAASSGLMPLAIQA